MADASWNRPWLKIQRDKKYGVYDLPVRLEFPFDFPPNKDMVDIAARPEIEKAIEQFERLGDGHGHKWQWMKQWPIKYVLSQMPSKEDLDTFNKVQRGELLAAISAQTKPTIVLNAMVRFVRPLDEVNLDQLEEERRYFNEKQGYVSEDAMPDEYKEYKRESVSNPS